MVNVSFLDSKKIDLSNVYGYSCNPFVNSDNDIYGSALMPSLFTNTNLNPCISGTGYFNYFNTDISFFNMYMNNQMSFDMQNQFFTKNYNTQTNLANLKKVYNPNLGNKLANIAEKNASNMNSNGWCARGTNGSLEKAGFANGDTRVSYAYQEADKLARNKNFKEVSVSRGDLKKLPAGCVVVWDRNYFGTKASDIYGHVTITLGDGREASDHVSKMYMLNSNYRVFVPVGLNQSA